MPENPSKREIGERFDAEFAKFKRQHPEATVATYYTRRHVLKNWALEKGHNSLGGKIVKQDGEQIEFWEAGRQKAENWIDRYNVAPTAKVVEYGCGTLRLAAHFIAYLPERHFFGLDVIPEFLEKGRDLIGAELIGEKAPVLAVIDDASIAAARDFAPDFVFSHAVMHHVHPDELKIYAANIASIASKPGCRVALNATCHPTPIRYGNLGWAQPEAQIVELFRPLEFAGVRKGKAVKRGRFDVQPAAFEFVRTSTEA
ncbi:class I SAM-dependent methyltransferase [Parasphingopyxis marina]|uniref:Class I SAM-dependent methyltransferase n=1 Tax=Parasphingopyxis marina TaxID=2761622 RepID=A0A842HUD9_9SPHN|nr:class I SAM-dependent methyltransferase [Parasphingopyxis marina]MBC2776027.1 class I SAM-dependent methyltransferase [Parasphingopyxis marina]